MGHNSLLTTLLTLAALSALRETEREREIGREKQAIAAKAFQALSRRTVIENRIWNGTKPA